MRGLGEVYLRKDRKGPFYWMKYYDAAGKRRRQSTGTTDKKLAEKILIGRIKEFDSLRNGIKHSSDMPYSVFGNEYIAHCKARYPFETVKSYTSAINEFNKYLNCIGISKISEISTPLINRYIEHRRVSIGNKTNTCNNHLKNLHAQLQFAISEKLLTENPADKVKKLEVNDMEEKKALSKDEYQAIMQEIKQRYPFYYPIFYVYFHTGLRFTELVKQKWDDILWEQSVLRVTKPKGKKRVENDYISLHQGVIKVLKSLPKRNPIYVFTDEKGNQFGPRTRKFIRRLQTIAEELKIKNVNLHTTRHTFCSQLFAIGLTLPEVQAQMRHTEISTTQKYSHIFRPQMNKKMEKLRMLDKSGA